jgi:hypothetical protein
MLFEELEVIRSKCILKTSGSFSIALHQKFA